MRTLVWFRNDLRVADNTALHRAAAIGDVVGVFIVTAAQWKRHDWGATKSEFVLRSAAALAEELAKLNIPLRVLSAPTFADIPAKLLKLAKSLKSDRLTFNREYEVNESRRDEAVTQLFESSSLDVEACHDQTILPPTSPRTGEGRYYTVFTPYRRSWYAAVKQLLPITPLPPPKKQPKLAIDSDTVPLRAAGFEKSPVDPALWPAGEREAQRRLARFIADPIRHYKTARDFPAVTGTSSLSPYLACGSISPRQCLAAAMAVNRNRLDTGDANIVTWISELIWREFYRHVLVGFPRVCMNKPFKLVTDQLKWNDDEESFRRWCDGKTGVPIVDAAMRQLFATGWMHNRLRMIVAMYLTKDLLIDWRRGERFFMQHLIDGDLASNNGGWQWAASTGTDAVPYFRIFNPVSQSKRFDPRGEFIRQWCPELAALDDRSIHDPAQLPALMRNTLDWPAPLVDHAAARLRTLAAFKAIREQ